MGFKAVETVRNINQMLGHGTINKRTAQHWFQKFCNGDEGLENVEGHEGSSAIDDNQLSAITESDPRKTTHKVTEELNVNRSIIVQHLHQIGKSKQLKTAIIFVSTWYNYS